MAPTGPARTRTPWILALLVVLALGLRLASTGRLLPQLREPDAFEVYEMQRVQRDPALVRNVLFEERYPWFLAWTLAALPAARAPAVADAAAAGAEALHLATAAEPFWRVRVAVALLATLQVLLTFFLARRFLPEGQALIATFLVATSLLHLYFSVQARPHGANAGLSLLALIAALQLEERFGLARLALAILASAAAVATFQFGFATLPPLGLACLLLRGRGPVLRIALALLAPLAALALALPWYRSLPSLDRFGLHFANVDGGGHTLFFTHLQPFGAWRSAWMLLEHDPGLALLAAGGSVLVLVRARALWKAADMATRRALALAGAFAIPSALAVSIESEACERFLMPLLPFAALPAAAFLAWLWRWQRARIPAALAFVALPALSAAQFTRLALAPDSLEQAASWIRANVDGEARILVFPDTTLPLFYSRESVAAQLLDTAGKNVPWVTYQATIPALPEGTRTWNVHCIPAALAVERPGPETKELRERLVDERVDYLVVDSNPLKWNWPVLPRLEAAARGLGQIVFRSTGAPPGPLALGGLDYQTMHWCAWRHLQQGALGPEVRIWKLTQR